MRYDAILSCRGQAAIALVFFLTLMIAALLTLHAAAVIGVGNTSRAVDTARQNLVTRLELELATAEAVQISKGVGVAPATAPIDVTINSLLAKVPASDATVTLRSCDAIPGLGMFPVMGSTFGAAETLNAPSSALGMLATPEMLELVGYRVAESASFEIHYGVDRDVLSAGRHYGYAVTCRLVGVPLSRYRCAGYDLPGEIGGVAASISWPAAVANSDILPRGLVSARDPAAIASLQTGANKSGYYRRRAAIAEAFQYVFSTTYYNRLIDYSSNTHFVNVSGDASNPALAGGASSGSTYTLDVGQFGSGTFGTTSRVSNAAVLYATGSGARLVLVDSVGSGPGLLLLVLGPAGVGLGRMDLEIGSPINRPIVIVAVNVNLVAAGSTVINGSLLLDPACVASAGIGPIQIGHLSYWLGSTGVDPTVFQFSSIPAEAEALMPRVVFVATQQRAL